jgi:hypothetical protein
MMAVGLRYHYNSQTFRESPGNAGIPPASRETITGTCRRAVSAFAVEVADSGSVMRESAHFEG